MYIIKNAVISILRNKGRNLLVGGVVLTIACAVSVTLAINNASENLIKSYEAKYEVEATLGMNRDNMMKDFDPQDMETSRENMREMFSGASVAVEDVEKYGESEYVTSYYYTVQAGINSDDMEVASMTMGNDGNSSRGGFGFGGMMPGGMSEGGPQNTSSADFTLKGYSSVGAMKEFLTGNYKITEGEVSEDFQDETCLINNELATLNDLSVGDVITVKDAEDESKTYALTIGGIFEEEDDDNKMSMFAGAANTIITNANFVEKMGENDSELSLSVEPTFVLTGVDVVEEFENELKDKGLSENLSVQTNLDEVDGATSTISNVKTFAMTFLIITLIIGAVVLFVINAINIRERKYEIGVLRTIGMKKSKVCAQFLLELTMVSAVALMMGAGVGAMISVPVSNGLLQSEIDSAQNESESIRSNFGKGGRDAMPGGFGGMDFGGEKGFRGVAQVQAFDSIDAAVDLKVLGELLVIGIILTLLSSISAMASIQKFSPLEILKERA